MRQVSLEEIKDMAENCRESIWEQAKAYGREPKIYLHWTAGHYGQYYLNDYHIAIDYDGSIYVEHDLDEVLAHTYRRNTGAVGITLACCVGATSDDLGSEPPTAEQIEVMAQVITVVADGLWLTIDKDHVMTHGEAADNEDGIYPHDPYGPKSTCERWDLEYLGTSESPSFNPYATNGSRGGDVLRGKAIWYHNQGV
ncbi:hypothetical protein MITSMUL_03167 [Mitsuokella multacida DSM 20544]|uniref:N-acetylmuramoyl-L-alanine amidase domain-containing protein n=2 Tax=Mitsuokella multacida TaxID=52226 RepID=C9KJG8_9FIRM|nr:hypothetical protein MITSMUL_03167 [Mitsuokella multacida DSM 20544]